MTGAPLARARGAGTAKPPLAGRIMPAGFTSLLSRYGIYLFMVVFLLVAAVAAPSFFSRGNLSNLVLQIVPLAIVACGQAMVILVRGLDLSVSSVMATAAVVATSFSGHDADIPSIVLLSLAIGMCAGLVNGLLVVKRNVSPFLATLATMIVLQGLRFAWTHGAPSGLMPPLLHRIGAGTWGFIPMNLPVLLAVALPLVLVLHRTTLGRRVVITGGNPMTGRLLGYPVDAIVIGAYMLSGCLARSPASSWAATRRSSTTGSAAASSSTASWRPCSAVSPCRVAGGNVAGVIAGSIVLALAGNIVLLIGLPVQFQIILKGVVIVFAQPATRGAEGNMEWHSLEPTSIDWTAGSRW